MLTFYKDWLVKVRFTIIDKLLIVEENHVEHINIIDQKGRSKINGSMTKYKLLFFCLKQILVAQCLPFVVIDK